MPILTALAPERDTFIAPRTFSGTVTVRKSANELSAQEIADYRLAVYRIAQISAKVRTDDRGYQWVAGIHGIPQRKCKHGSPAFALWHRPYVQLYEQLLQDVVPTAFVPYWNWTRDLAIPQIFLDATWSNPDTGATEPNPLLSQPMNGGAPTSRRPQPASRLAQNRRLVSQALLATDYDAFSADLENPHNNVHVWVGGDMSSIPTAAYDPLFWSHHCFVEYVFCQWQDAHTAAPQPSDVTNSDLIPFGVTVDQIWIYKKLGYTYKPAAAKPLALSGTSAPGPGAAEANSLHSGATVASFAPDGIEPDFNRAELRFEGLTLPEDSFEVRVFAGAPNADATTPTDDNPAYLGSQFFFGHGECTGAEGHCDVVERDIFDIRPKHHYYPVRVRLNVTRRLRVLLLRERGETDLVPVTLVAVDPDGNEIDEPGLRFEGLTIVVR
jgi:tyrosinase